MLDLKFWRVRKLNLFLCIVRESCHFVNKCQNYNLNISKSGRPMHENYFFPGKDALPLKMICYQMSRCILTKGNIALAL